MKLNKTETRRMLNVKHDIEKAFRNGDLRKFNNIPFILNDCFRCYNNIVETTEHEGTTITSESAEYYKKNGFYIREYGIGYCVSIKNPEVRT
jgi:hypothetical protein